MILDTIAIQAILPHRYPFLMVDSIIEMEGLKRIVSAMEGKHAVPSRLEHNFADGERLFVIVHTKNCFLGLHRCTGGPVATFFIFEMQSEMNRNRMRDSGKVSRMPMALECLA